MTIKDKKEYLERYEKAMERFLRLDESLHGIKGKDYTQIKTSSHKSLEERIEECENAYRDAFLLRIHLEAQLKKYDVILSFKYVALMSDEEIAEALRIPVSSVKRRCNKALKEFSIFW